VILLLGLLDRCLRLPYFAPLVHAPGLAVSRDGRWWAALVAGALLPAATLYPFFELGARVLPATALLPQAFTNETVVWAVLNALLVWLLARLPGGASPSRDVPRGRALALAALTFAVGYAVVAGVYAAFETDLRFWFFALKPMSPRQAGAFGVYLVPFSAFFVVALRSLHARLTAGGDSAARQYAIAIVALSAGFVVLLLAQYAGLFAVGRLTTLFMNDTLRTIVAINFLPLVTVVAIVSTFAHRRTASHLPGALLCAGLVAWYVVVGQATQAG
jgi:hypothetical protein